MFRNDHCYQPWRGEAPFGRDWLVLGNSGVTAQRDIRQKGQTERDGNLFISLWTFSGVRGFRAGDAAERQWGLPQGEGGWEPLAVIPAGHKSGLAV